MQIKRASENTARAVAAMLTAASPIAGAFPASAQQVAASDVEVRQQVDAIFAHCKTIADHGKQAQCYMDASIANSKKRIGAAEQKIAAGAQQVKAAESVSACARFIMGKRDGEGLKVDVTRATADKVCIYARELGMQ